MNIYPKLYLDKVTSIDIELLKKLDIKGLILDVDNTLIDYSKNLLEGAKKWCENLKKHGIVFCIASNSNNEKKLEDVSKALGIPYVAFSMKPFSKGLLKAKKIINMENKDIAVVGDQIFTDVMGANNLGMFSILTQVISEKEGILTKIKRPIEKKIIDKYLKMNKQNSKE